jgi:hypothetical protein
VTGRIGAAASSGQLCPAENKNPFKHCGSPPKDHQLGTPFRWNQARLRVG